MLESRSMKRKSLKGKGLPKSSEVEAVGALGNMRNVLGSGAGVALSLTVGDVERHGDRVKMVREISPERLLTRSEIGRVIELVGGWWVVALEFGVPPKSVAEYCKMAHLDQRRVYESQACFRRAFPEMRNPNDLAMGLGIDLSARYSEDVSAVVLAMLRLVGR